MPKLMLDELIPLSPLHFFDLSFDCFFFEQKSLTTKHVLPNLEDLYGESFFADVKIGWSEQGILVSSTQNRTLFSVRFPDFYLGDSIELFFDTRSIKNVGYNTRFCHHFYFLPEPVPTNGETLARISHQHSSRFGQAVFPGVEEASAGKVKSTLPRMPLKADGNTGGQSGRTVGEKCGLGGEITRFRGEEAHELCDASLLEVSTQKKKGKSETLIFIPKEALYGYDPLQFNRMGFTYRINHFNGQKQHFAFDADEVQNISQPSLWASLNLRK